MKSKRNLIILAIVIAISLIGVTYAFFDYYMLGSNQKITAGKVNLLFNEGDDTINRANIFPETVTKARSRNDNFITFTVSGVNTSEDEDLYYEIMLNEGDPETGMTRFDPEDLVFDLVELDADGNEGTYLVDAMSYSDFNARRIWVNTVDRNTATTINKTYKLRMWLSEEVMISDSNSSADYPATGYENYYASVKVSVYGDFVEKSVPYNYLVRFDSSSFWPTAINDQKTNISEVHFISLSPNEINTRVTASTINADVTDISLGGSVKVWLETDTADTTKYIMYVASDGTTYFPSDCSSMFNGFSSVSKFNFINNNTSKIVNMQQMFLNCSNILELDLSDWDVSSVTNINGMFVNCAKLNNLNLRDWDLSQMSSFSGFGYGFASLETINLSNWKLGSITSLSGMFSYCSSIINMDLSNWDLSNISSTSGMFVNCSNLTNLNLNGWIGANNITNTSSMFTNCSKLVNLDLSSFTFDNVTTTTSMFKSMSDTTIVTVGGTTQQNWVLALPTTDRPAAWTTSNVVVKQ